MNIDSSVALSAYLIKGKLNIVPYDEGGWILFVLHFFREMLADVGKQKKTESLQTKDFSQITSVNH